MRWSPSFKLELTARRERGNRQGGFWAALGSFLCVVLVLSALPSAAQDWTQVIPATGGQLPPPRTDAGGFYDTATNRMIIFGGSTNTCSDAGGSTLNDVWRLDNANGLGGAPAWTPMNPVAENPTNGLPLRRRYPSTAYNPASNRMIVFGGDQQPCGNLSQKLNDVWVLTNANGNGGTPVWQRLFPSGGPPPARSDNRYWYDPATNRFMIFAGWGGTTGLTPTDLADLWVLTNADGTGSTTPQWIPVTPGGSGPGARSYPSTVYDQANNRVILFGGFVQGDPAPARIFNDTWILTNANGVGTPQWTPLNPTGTLPAKRAGAVAAFFPGTNQMVLFGGAVEDVANGGSRNGFNPQANDTWVLSGANGLSQSSQWQHLTETNSPSTRGGATSVPLMLFDPATSRALLFGGFHYTSGNTGDVLNDTWEFAPARTITLTPPTATNPTGTSHTVTATIRDSAGNLYSNMAVSFTITAGPNAGASGTCSPVNCTTTSAGQVSFTYFGTRGAGTDTIQASFTDVGGTHPTIATKTWFVPVNITLSPANATNPVGTSHTVIARVQDTSGNPQPNVAVAFAIISGPSFGSAGVCNPANCRTDASGQVSFTYTGLSRGTDLIQASFTDGSGAHAAMASKTWFVPLSFVSGCPASPAILGTAYSQSVSASGGGGAISYSVAAGSLPPGLSLSGNTIAGTPTKVGSYPFTIQASSGDQSAQLGCAIRVDAPPVHITSGCPAGSGTQGVPYGPFALSANGGLGQDSYIFSIIGNLPGGVSLSGNQIAGTPTASGTSTFRIQVTSGNSADTTGVCTVAIAPPPFPALQLNGSCPAPVPANSPVSIPFTASGGNGTYQFSLSAGSSGLTLTSNGNSATLTGTPAAAGSYPFTVTLTDTGGSTPVTRQCTLVVSPPVLNLTGTCPATVVQGGSVSAPFSASGGVPPYSWSLSSVPGLSLTSSSGAGTSITGTAPNAGSYPFIVSLSDSVGQIKTQPCTLTVTQPPPAPLVITAGAACPTSLTAPASFTVPISGSGGTPPYSWDVTATPAGTSAIGLTAVSGSNTSVTGSLTSPGTYGFTLTLADAANAPAATFTCANIQVSAPSVPTVGVSITAPKTLQENAVFTINLQSASTVDLQGVATLTFTPNAAIPNSAVYTGVRFSNSSTTAAFIVTSGQTTVTLPPVQQGTVAGTIHVQLTSLTANGVPVLPSPAPAADLVIPKSAPVITDLHLDNQSASGFTIVIQGYSTPREIVKATISFTAAADASIDGASSFDLTSVGSVLNAYYADPNRLAAGSAFDNLRIPVSIDGDLSAIGSVSVTLTNSAGTSDAKTVSVQSGP